MAEETPVSPIVSNETPKANPIVKPGATPGTLKLSPLAHKPGVGVTSALKPGLKLPPKPGAGVTAALKPGLKLPPKPVIHKPGATVAAKPLPKPVTAPAAPAPAAPAAPAPDAAAVPPIPAQPLAPAAVQSAPEAPKPMEALKSVTQKLKGITQQIPQQAILRKTGIIADAAMTDAQKQAAKSKTARIALSDALGVAPVKNENAPMKTIRIKRPTAIPAAGAASAAPAMAPVADDAGTEASATMTQRKTLKISRPGGAVRPTGKFGVKHAEAAADVPTVATMPGGDVSDISDIPDMAPVAPIPMPVAADEGPAWPWTLSSVIQVAACGAMGALAWFLYQNTVTNYF